MSIVIVTVALACVIFLTYFLVAITLEPQMNKSSVKQYSSRRSSPATVEKLRFSTRAKLRFVDTAAEERLKIPLFIRVQSAAGERFGQHL